MFAFVSKTNFSFQKTILTNDVPKLVEKTKQLYVLLALA
jgi:hypothetical protein